MENRKRVLYHKCTVVGFVNLLEGFEASSRICTSSGENSTELFWRNACLVLNVPEKNIVAEHYFDLDSRSETLYDEVRVKFTTKEELLQSVEAIICEGNQLRKIRAGNYKSPDVVEGRLPTKFFDGINHEKADSLAIKYFFENIVNECDVLTLTEAKKRDRKWNREFLNM